MCEQFTQLVLKGARLSAGLMVTPFQKLCHKYIFSEAQRLPEALPRPRKLLLNEKVN